MVTTFSGPVQSYGNVALLTVSIAVRLEMCAAWKSKNFLTSIHSVERVFVFEHKPAVLMRGKN